MTIRISHNMKALKFIALLMLMLLTNGCASLKPVTYNGNTSLIGYKYAYITPTSGLSSSSGGVYGNAYGVYGSTIRKASIRQMSYPEF